MLPTSAAIFRNAQQITCVSPAQSNGSLVLEVTVDNQRFTEDAVNFTFHAMQNLSDATRESPTVFVSAIHPVSGPSRGGTLVTIVGGGFVPSSRLSASQPAFRNRELDHELAAYQELQETMTGASGVFCVFTEARRELFGAAVTVR